MGTIGIRFNGVLPWFTRTEMVKKVLEDAAFEQELIATDVSDNGVSRRRRTELAISHDCSELCDVQRIRSEHNPAPKRDEPLDAECLSAEPRRSVPGSRL